MLKYHPQHCWVETEARPAAVGLSALALEKLGEIIYIDLPQKGDRLRQGQEFGELESAKTTAELVAPLSGLVKAVNQELEDNLEPLNTSPQDRGWLCRIEPDETGELEGLLTEADYLALAGQEE